MKNTGIYALYWWEQDLIYIGLSQSLALRKREHLYKCKNNKHTNYKVQEAYNLYGEPEFIVLEFCKVSELAIKEIYWCNEFKALEINGLCLVEPGTVGFGASSNASKYTKLQILKVFSLLYKGKHTISQISSRLGVKESLCIDIAKGNTHGWLEEKYPKQYALMLNIKDRSKIKYRINKKATLQKEGILYDVYCVKEFCRTVFGKDTHSSGICRVISGKRDSYKGFSLVL